MNRRRFVWTAMAVVLMAITVLPCMTFAETTVRIDGVPEELSFPLPKGRNVVLTATVEGPEPEAVWLARSRDARGRFLLARAGEGVYQVNLAEPEASAILQAEDKGGEFRIFAQMPDGEVIECMPIHYAVRKPSRRAQDDAYFPFRRLPEIYVHVDGEREAIGIEPFPDLFGRPFLRAEVSGQALAFSTNIPSDLFGTGRTTTVRWFSPARVQKIEFKFEEDAVGTSAETRVGKETWSAQATQAANVLALPVTPEVREAWEAAGSLTLMCREQDQEVRRAILKAPPRRLHLPAGGAEITIVQRTTGELPGSDGYLWMHIDDITKGQTLVSVATAGAEHLIKKKSMRRGDEARFKVGEEGYVIRVEKLVNFLVGDDYAVFVITPAAVAEVDEMAEREKIEQLIGIMEESEITFLRADKEYTPAEGAEHLRKKYDFAREDIHTLGEFIDKVASRSWISGREYGVRLPDGVEVKAGEWLRRRAAEITETKAPNQAPQSEGKQEH